MKRRYLIPEVAALAWAHNKMAFVSGPRQCGKTTMAKIMLGQRKVGAYHNWDDIEFRRIWTKQPRATLGEKTTKRPLVIYDEIHKARGWKRTLKGLFDTMDESHDILVTGSARLNVYKRGGDSLLGRYFNFRLHPFSLGELGGRPMAPDSLQKRLEQPKTLSHGTPSASLQEQADSLLKFGGFPEPWLKQSERFSRIWRSSRIEKIVREDLRDISRLPELSQVEMLVSILPERVAGPLSVQALREDLEVAHTTVTRWLGYLKELYYLYELKPYARSIPRALKREGKLYLWDWGEVSDPGPRYENMVAGHLLKACHFWTDTGEGQFELRYIKDKQRREIDFLVLRDKRPMFLVEAKLTSKTLSPSLVALVPKLRNVPFVQLVFQPIAERRTRIGDAQGRVMSAASFLRLLP